MQFIFRIPSRFMTVFLDLILVSQFTMRYYLENPSDPQATAWGFFCAKKVSLIF